MLSRLWQRWPRLVSWKSSFFVNTKSEGFTKLRQGMFTQMTKRSIHCTWCYSYINHRVVHGARHPVSICDSVRLKLQLFYLQVVALIFSTSVLQLSHLCHLGKPGKAIHVLSEAMIHFHLKAHSYFWSETHLCLWSKTPVTTLLSESLASFRMYTTPQTT
ncbi:hypothetical protein M758_8G013100 [Ceratodon purpureus]|nr:hypothetical protein M758_8G013100 [Ceratodon purpureus]